MQITGIYTLKNPDGDVYVGQTRNFEGRIRMFRCPSNVQQKLVSDSFKKYGFQNHVISVAHKLPNDVEQSVLDNYERLYIDAYKNCGTKVMNQMTGGISGSHHSEESKRKMSIGNLGRKQSEEWTNKIREKNKGRKNTEETKLKISIAKTGKGKAINYTQYIKDNTGIKTQEIIARELGIHQSTISRFLKRCN